MAEDMPPTPPPTTSRGNVVFMILLYSWFRTPQSPRKIVRVGKPAKTFREINRIYDADTSGGWARVQSCRHFADHSAQPDERGMTVTEAIPLQRFDDGRHIERQRMKAQWQQLRVALRQPGVHRCEALRAHDVTRQQGKVHDDGLDAPRAFESFQKPFVERHAARSAKTRDHVPQTHVILEIQVADDALIPFPRHTHIVLAEQRHQWMFARKVMFRKNQ